MCDLQRITVLLKKLPLLAKDFSVYPYSVSSLKNLIHSCNFGYLGNFKPFFSTCFQDGWHQVLPPSGLAPAPIKRKCVLHSSWLHVGPHDLCEQQKVVEEIFFDLQVRSKEVLLLPLGSLGLIALESELLCNGCGYPETTTQWEALHTWETLEARERCQGTPRPPTCGWDSHLGNRPTLQSHSPQLSPCGSKSKHPVKPFSNSWPTKSGGKIKWLF